MASKNVHVHQHFHVHKVFLDFQRKGDNEAQSELQNKKEYLQQLYTEIEEEH